MLLIHRDSASTLLLPELEALDAYLDVHGSGISKGFPMLLKVVYDEASPELSYMRVAIAIDPFQVVYPLVN